MQALSYRRQDIANLSAVLEKLGCWEKLLLEACFGFILGLSSPGFDWWWLAWIGLVPVILLSRACKDWQEAFLNGLIFGLAYQCVCHRWLLGLYPLTAFHLHDMASLVIVGLVWFVESLHQSLLFALFSLFIYALPLRSGFLPHYQRPYYPFLFSVPVIWFFLHWVIGPSTLFLGLPVNQLAYSQSNVLPFVQVCRLGGPYLLEFVLLLVNCAFAAIVFEFCPALVSKLPERTDRLSSGGGALFDAALIFICVLACFIYGNSCLKKTSSLPPASFTLQDKKNYAPALPVALIQGNMPVYPEQFQGLKKNERLERYVNLTGAIGAVLLVVPEAAIHLSDGEGKELASYFDGICYNQKKEIIAGALEVVQSSLANVVRLLGEKTDECYYVKNRLLPLVEIIPSQTFAGLIPENFFKLLPSSQQKFLQASFPLLLKSVWGKVGASISFEIVYPDLMARQASDGASLLVNVSDLSWFHNDILAKQLLAAGVLRAIENGRYLIMASNTGISAVINPCGVITSFSVAGQKGIVLDRVQFLHKKTPFTRMKWLWGSSY